MRPHMADDLKQHGGPLWQLLDVLTQDDTPQLLHDVMRRLARLLQADEVALFAGQAPPVLITAHGQQVFAEQQQIVDRRLSHAVTGATTISLPADDTDEVWQIDPHTTIHTGLWVPAPAGAPTPAVVRVLRIRHEAFPSGTARLLQIVAQRLAGALHRLQQLRFDQARDAERTQLFLVSASIAQELDFELVAQRVVEGVTSVTDFAAATVEVRHGNSVQRAAAFGTDLTVGVGSPLEVWQDALGTDDQVGELTYRVALDKALPVEADDAVGTMPGLVTQLRNRDGDIVGFLTLSHPRTGAEPTQPMVQTIELFARQAQIALVNAALYVDAKRQRDIARTLMRVTAAVSASLDTDEILATCCEAAATHSVGERASIYLLDDHGDVNHATSFGHDADVPASARGPRPLGECTLLTEAVQSPEPLIVDDLTHSVRHATAWLSRALQLRSAAVYPLRAGGDTLGLLVVDSHTTTVHFDAHETGLLSQIAAQAAIALRQSSLHAQTREQAARNAQLLELTTAMTTTFEFKDIFERIVQAVRTRMDGRSVSVLRVGDGVLEVLGTITDEQFQWPRSPLRLAIDDALEGALHAVWEGGTLRLEDVRENPALVRLAWPTTRGVILAAPSDRSDTNVLLSVSSEHTAAFTAADERFLGDLIQVTQLAVRNAELFDEVFEAARRDPLTGLLNRRVFWEVLAARLKRLNDDRTVAVAVVDADDFKGVNDRFGHAVGDAALAHIADRLQRSMRQTDQVFRIGGEEFTVVMPDATAEEAYGVMMRVLTAVRQSRADLPPLSVSIGIAVAPQDGRTADTLFGEADRALLRAKRTGKDRVVRSGEPV